jgi:DNA modification methylase
MLIESLDIPKTTIEHWFRNDIKGFSYPSIEHWELIKDYLDNWDDEFEVMDKKMTFVIYETDDINKNLEKGKNPGDVSDFWDIPTKPNKESHYAQYNDELIRKPIIAGCPENGLIYDPFMGSGSTAEACIRAKRNYIGSEMSLEYLDIANKRLEQHKKQLKLL